MGYANPFMQWGYQRLAGDLQGAGVDGLIVPDLLPEANDELASACAAHDLDVISLVAPTTPPSASASWPSGEAGFSIV